MHFESHFIKALLIDKTSALVQVNSLVLNRWKAITSNIDNPNLWHSNASLCLNELIQHHTIQYLLKEWQYLCLCKKANKQTCSLVNAN